MVYTVSSQESTIADQGQTSLTQSASLDTRAKVENQDNYQTRQILSYSGSNTGLATTDESLLLDGAGTPFPDWNILTCPFAKQKVFYNPAFCNIVEMGSSATLRDGTLVRETREHHVVEVNRKWEGYSTIHDNLGVPISDPGVAADFEMILSGGSTSDHATGQASAFLNAHIMEAEAPPFQTEDYTLPPFPRRGHCL